MDTGWRLPCAGSHRNMSQLASALLGKLRLLGTAETMTSQSLAGTIHPVERVS